MERWLSGRKRAPAKCVLGEIPIEGSNPSLSTSLRLQNCHVGDKSYDWQASVLKKLTCEDVFIAKASVLLDKMPNKSDTQKWRDGRAVECDGLENRYVERHRGFESLSLHQYTPTELPRQ